MEIPTLSVKANPDKVAGHEPAIGNRGHVGVVRDRPTVLLRPANSFTLSRGAATRELRRCGTAAATTNEYVRRELLQQP